MKFFSQQLPRKKFHFVMFQERYIIENRYKMPGKSISGYYKPVTDPFNCNDFQRRIFF